MGWDLKEVEIRKAKAVNSVLKLYDGDGLHVVIRPAGSKVFYLRCSIKGKRRDIRIGKYPDFSLKQARARAVEIHAAIDAGEEFCEDPRPSAVFRDVAETWIHERKNKLSDKDKRLIRQRLRDFALPFLGDMAVANIRTVHVKKVVDSAIVAGKAETAKRCLSYLSQIFRYAILCELCEFDVTAPLVGYIKAPQVKNMARITDLDDLAELLRAAWDYSGTARVRYGLRLSFYCFVRPRELRCAEWCEIDFKKKLWTIDADKMKMRRPHIIPLSNQALVIFKKLRRLSSDKRYIFSGDIDKPMSENTINHAFKRLGYKDRQTAHGLRGTASTLLHELGYNTLHIEAQLAHAESSSVKAAYNHAVYLDQRKVMMQEYADYLDGLRTGSPFDSKQPIVSEWQ